MQIKVKLFATLREGRGKIIELSYNNPVTPKAILDELNIHEKDVAILLINGIDGSFEQELQDHDTLSIFPPVGGG